MHFLLLPLVAAVLARAAPIVDLRARTDGVENVTQFGDWSWYDLPGTQCADGSQTGFGFSAHPDATELVVFFEGGGACYDALGCYVFGRASDIGGFGASDFDGLDMSQVVFQRIDDNPYAAASYVYIPYCTGDLHAGDATQSYLPSLLEPPFHHHGALNSEAVLQRVAKLLASQPPQRVLVTGQSAGGFGAVLNYKRAQSHFANARVDLLADSGEEADEFLYKHQATWNLQRPTCPTCDNMSYNTLLPGFAKESVDNGSPARFGAVSFSTDSVLPGYFGVSQQAMADVIAQYFALINTASNAHTFTQPGTGHVVTNNANATSQNGTSLYAWLTQLHSDDPAWDGV